MNCYPSTSFSTSHITLANQYSSPYSSEIGDYYELAIISDIPKTIFDILMEIIRTLSPQFETDYSSTINYGYTIPTESFPFSLDFFRRLSIQNIQELSDFFTQHNDILPVFLFGCKLCTDTFGPDVELSVDIVQDPDSDFECIEVNVRKTVYEDNFMEMLESLSDRYWNTQMDTSSYFIISTDFQPPVKK
ncbi:MAG: hypothetical protein PHF57_12415 [Methanoregula sp.]|jgi:hypothetical protein|nr:hypothetical protein [Methanoregula sp.]MDD5189000.1 hypothetical protein [Methanoregula sp.]